MEAIESLYREEISALRGQIEELKLMTKTSEDKNSTLLDKIRSLQYVIEQANVANQDLHTAFEHVRDENSRLRSSTGAQDQIVVFEDRAIESVQRQGISWISDKDKYIQRIKFLERECERYNRDNKTLHKQANHLLRTLEEERGMIIRRAEQDEPLISASDVIDRHLVTYESIEELQRQNQKLVSLVKDLSRREEEQLESEDLKGLNKEIESLKSQLESVKNDRERIINGFNTIHKERDLFKILLCKTRQVEHMTPEIFQRMVSIACSSGAIATGAIESEDKTAHINDLKSMITRLEQQVEDARRETASCKTKAEEELKLKSELLEQAHLKLKQVDILQERCQVLEANTNLLMKEYDESRTKNHKLTFELEKAEEELKQKSELLEQANSNLKQVDILQERCQVLESNANLLMKEYDESRTKNHKLAFELEKAEEELKQKSELLEQAHSKLKQVDILQERCQVLESDANKLMKEYDESRTKNHKLAFELEKAEEELKLKAEHLEQAHLKPKLVDVLQEGNNLELEDLLEMQRLRNIERARALEYRSILRKNLIPNPIQEEVAEPKPTQEKDAVMEPEMIQEELAEPKVRQEEVVVMEPEVIQEEVVEPKPTRDEVAVVEPKPTQKEPVVVEPKLTQEEVAEPKPTQEEVAELEANVEKKPDITVAQQTIFIKRRKIN